MIYLIAHSNAKCCYAASFLKLPATSWAAITHQRQLQGLAAADGDLFIWVKAPRSKAPLMEIEFRNELRRWLWSRKIHTLEYTLP